MNIIILTLLLSILSLSCSHKEQERVITIRVNSSTEKVSFDQVVDSIVTLPLSETPLPIGQITKIFFVGDKIIIEDRIVSRAIFVFDRNGQFLNMVGSKGRGDGEYRLIHASTVNQKTQEVVILDNTTALFYSLDGTFQRKEEIGACGSDFIFGEDGRIHFYLDNGVFYGDEKKNNQLLSLHNNEIVLDSFPALPEDFRFIYQYNNLFSYPSGTYFCPNLTDRVYQLSERGVEPIYQVEIEGTVRPQVDNVTTQEHIEFTDKYRTFDGMFVDGNRWAWFGLNAPQKEYVLYRKEQKNSVVVTPSEQLQYRFLGTGNCYTQKNDQYLVNDVYPYAMIDLLKNTPKDDPQYESLEEMIKKLRINEDSNPILFFYRIK